MTITMRISDETLAAVRDQTDLVALIGESVDLTADGTVYRGPCWMHPAEDAALVAQSLEVRPDRGLWYCHSCGRGGDAIEWLLAGNVLGTFGDAVEHLAERAGIAVQVAAARAPLPVGRQP